MKKKNDTEVSHKRWTERPPPASSGESTPSGGLDLYRSLVESSGDSIYLVDKDCRYAFVNKTHLDRLHLSPEDVIGRPYGDFHTKEQDKEFRKMVAEVWAAGRPLQHEHRSGRDRRYFLRTFSPVKDSANVRIIGVTVISKDITSHKQTEEALRESEEKYRLVVENVSEAILIAQDGILNFVNPAAVGILGRDRDKLTSRPLADFVHPDDREPLLSHHFRRLNGEDAPAVYGVRVVTPEGRVKWVEMHITVVNWHGKPASLVFMSDVTERRQTEEALKAAEELYRTLATNSQAAIYIVQDGKIRFTNPHLSRYSGYAPEDLIGRDILSFVHPDDRERVKGKAAAMLKGEQTAPYEYRIIDKSGRVRWLVETVASITYEGKRATLGSTIDITEHKEMEQQLEAAREMLLQAEKLAAVGKLTAGLAHEILNPVNIISIRIQLLEMTESLSDKTRETFRICRDQINRIVRITKGMNQFSRVTTEHMAPEDLNRLIINILSLAGPRLKLENVAVELDCQRDLPLLLLDKSRMEQVFLNLINNAVDAMSGKDRKTLRIASTRFVLDGMEAVRVTFSDNGTGISEKDMKKIFDPFFTTKDPNKGTGLGLSICYGIIQDHGGRIWAENNEQGGATFFIALPLGGRHEERKMILRES